jgi:hypothetical protein
MLRSLAKRLTRPKIQIELTKSPAETKRTFRTQVVKMKPASMWTQTLSAKCSMRVVTVRKYPKETLGTEMAG